MAEAQSLKDRKGWFKGLGRDGDRTLDEQMIGLERLFAEVPGKTVIDAGCAEGLITLEVAKAGAASCVGVEIVERFVDIAVRLAAEQGLPCKFVAANLNDFDVSSLDPADIVLMLAIAHKLKDPSRAVGELADLARELCVVRMPPAGPRIVDPRSGNVPHDVTEVMVAKGFALEAVVAGPLKEWTGYYRRVDAKFAPEPPAVKRAKKARQVTAPEETKAPEAETISAQPETETSVPETNASKQETEMADPKPEGAVEPMSTTNSPGIAPGAQPVDHPADDLSANPGERAPQPTEPAPANTPNVEKPAE